jgi:hypothetical protein
MISTNFSKKREKTLSGADMQQIPWMKLGLKRGL